MVTSLLILFATVLASVLATGGDRKWLLNMMLGLPEESRANYDPTIGASRRSPVTSRDNWIPEGVNNVKNRDWLYSLSDLNPDSRPDQSMEKKWSKFHFNGFICCNQPPTPHPKTKRLQQTHGDDLRGALLKSIARFLASQGLADSAGISNNIEDSYNAVDPRLINLPEMANMERRGVSARSETAKRGPLPDYERQAVSPAGYFPKRHQFTLPPYPFSIYPAKAGSIGLNAGNAMKRNDSDPKFRDYFRSLGGGR